MTAQLESDEYTVVTSASKIPKRIPCAGQDLFSTPRE